MHFIKLTILVLSVVAASAYTKVGTVYTTDGTHSDVSAALNNASAGDTVMIPLGTNTWGSAGAFMTIPALVTLQGHSRTGSVIRLASDSGDYTSGAIRLNSRGIARGFTVDKVLCADSNNKTPFSATEGVGGWRITDVKFLGKGSGYFLYAGNHGLIDNCDITGGAGDNELIVTRGPTNAWDLPIDLGSTNALYIEGNTFRGSGYVCDFNSRAKGVVRFNTITGQIKIDAHGAASNSPDYRSARSWEAYHNVWTAGYGYWTAFEMRGGSGVIFSNITVNGDVNAPWLKLNEYAVISSILDPWNGVWPTPLDLPIRDQIGVGQGSPGAQTRGAEPTYVFRNRRAGSYWPLTVEALYTTSGTTATTGYAIGVSNIVINTLSISTNNYIQIGSDTNLYLVIAKSGTTHTISPALLAEIPASATTVTAGPVTNYRGRTTNVNASFTLSTVITANTDYFAELDGGTFNGSSGMGIGTKAAMEAITGTTTNVGYWVTDEAEWNVASAGTDGQLYKWDGDSWNLYYTPLVYPHPLEALDTTPAFSVQPASATVFEGRSVTFTAAATGNPIPTLQWRKGGVNISAATSSTYTIAAPAEADEGSYDVVATNEEGSTASNAAILTVNQLTPMRIRTGRVGNVLRP